MSDLICPHCHNEVSRGAKVCRGCQAEVHYGYSFKEFLILLIGAIVSSVFAEKLYKPLGVIVLISIIILGIIVMLKTAKNRVIFKRRYNT